MEKEEEARGRAKMDKEGCSVCAEDLHTDPAQPRPGRGGMAALQAGAGADPSEGQLRCQRQGTHPQDLPKYWIFLRTQELIISNGENLQNEQKRRLG